MHNNPFIRKLNNKKGESLVEILITILLVGIVSSGFMVVVETANNMSKKALETDKYYYDDITATETGSGGTEDEAQVTITVDGGNEITATVTRTTGKSGIVSYSLPQAQEGGGEADPAGDEAP